MRRIGVGLLGLGQVGAGALRLLRDHAEAIAARLGAELVVRRIAVRDPGRARAIDVEPALLTDDPWTVVRDRDARVVVEAIGGVEPARALVLAALAEGKHVVTANKALLAEHGDEVFAAAERAGREVHFEAAVCGGVPVVRALREGLAADRVTALYGIVNGTCNFILTRMAEERRALADVLAEARRAGYAEADPTLDVEGGDAAHKLAILATLVFGAPIHPRQIFTAGVGEVEPADLRWAERFGHVVKHLAIARDHDGALELRVHPAWVPRRWLLASVGDAYNAVYVRSQALGSSLYYGRGAGSLPTGAAIVADLIEVGRRLLAFSSAAPPPRAFRRMRARTVLDVGELRTRYYLRLAVADRPGVLASVAGALAERGISIAEVVQERPARAAEPATLVILTHQARERDVQAARAGIDAQAWAAAPARLMRVEE